MTRCMLPKCALYVILTKLSFGILRACVWFLVDNAVFGDYENAFVTNTWNKITHVKEAWRPQKTNDRLKKKMYGKCPKTFRYKNKQWIVLLSRMFQKKNIRLPENTRMLQNQYFLMTELSSMITSQMVERLKCDLEWRTTRTFKIMKTSKYNKKLQNQECEVTWSVNCLQW